MSAGDDSGGHSHGAVPAPVPGAWLVVDAHGIVVGWSSQAQALLGYSAEEVLGQSVSVLLSGIGGHTAPHPSRSEAITGGVAIRHRSGHRLELGVQVRPTVGKDGESGTCRETACTPPRP